MKSRIVFAIATLIAFILAAQARSDSSGVRHFSVADDISFTRIVDSNEGGIDTTIKWAPDRHHFVVVTTTGDLAANSNIYKLICYEVGQDLASVKPKVVLSVPTKSNAPGITFVRWISNTELSFLRTEGTLPTQLFVASIDGSARAITRHPTAILDYVVSDDLKHVVIAAEEEDPSIDDISKGYIAGNQIIIKAVGAAMRFPLFRKQTYFEVDVETGSEKRIPNVEYTTFTEPTVSQMCLSPNGEWAVVRADGSESQSDSSYSSVDAAYPDYLLGQLGDRPDGESVRWSNLDVSSSQRGGLSDVKCLWTADGASLYLLHHQNRSGHPTGNGPASIEVIRFPSLKREQVATLPISLGARITGAEKDRVGVEIWNGEVGSVYDFAGHDGVWLKEHEGVHSVTGPIEISIHEDLNDAPELFATDAVTKQSVQVSRFNPQFEERDIGWAEEVRWHDSAGKEWAGAFLAPPVSSGAHRPYALVIQTHGYEPKTFWLNGDRTIVTSGYAARALAARGLAVLQVPDDHSEFASPREIPNNIRMIAGAVRELVNQGWVDPHRIGIHGASRTGYVVQAALFTSKFKVAAASVAEGDEVSKSEYTESFGARYAASMPAIEGMYDVPPLFGEAGARAWAERDPTNHLDRVHCPLLIQGYQAFVDEWWDTYAILRRNRRPVEYMYFPYAAHVPKRPVELLAAQGSVVDWYDFWLNNHEDPDPSKASQYSRWRQMRELVVGAQ